MKGIFPTWRKWNRSAMHDDRELGPRRKRPTKVYKAARSFDESLESPRAFRDKGYFSSKSARSLSDDVNSALHDIPGAYYSSDSDGRPSPSPDDFHDIDRAKSFEFDIDKPAIRGILKHQPALEGPSPGSSPVYKMVDQQDIITLTQHVRGFSVALRALRECFLVDDEDNRTPEEVKANAHNRLGDVVSILKGVIQSYPTLNPTEILSSAGILIKKIKDHSYDHLEEPTGFFETTDQLALAFSNSVSDYLEEDLSQNLGQMHPDNGHMASFENLQNASAYDDDDDKRAFSDVGAEFTEFYEENSEKAASEESLDKMEYDGNKRLSFNLDARANSSMNESEMDKNVKPDLSVARAKELDNALFSIEGSVDISLQRTKVWSKYAKDIITYMERRAHIESDYCKQLAKLAQATKAVITEESYLPFQSTYVTALEYDINFAKKCQEKLQHDLKRKIIEQLTFRRNEHDRNRSKLKERWNKECKKLNDSILNLKKAKSMYIQKQQELKKFVDKQEKEEGNQSSSVVPSFSIGKKKKEEDIAKRAEEAEDYYKKCVEETNLRQNEIEKIRETILRDLRELVYQCDMTLRAVTCGYFQIMEHLAAHLPHQYLTLAKDSKQTEVGKQFAEFIKLQQTTSKKVTPKRFSFELYRADDRTDSDKGYIGPADFLSVSSPDPDLEQRESPNHVHRRISTISAGSDTSLNRPSSPVPTKKRHNAWGVPNRNSNSDDTASVSSRSLPGSPAGSPTLARKDNSQRLSLSTTEMEVREAFKKEVAAPFRNLKMSYPAMTHTFKKLRSSSKCKKCDSYVYFNGAECELCGLSCHKKCLETLAIKCGKARLPRKMTTFGVDFQKHLNATKRQDIPLIMEKCMTEIDLRCLQVKGIYRVSGVKTKVEALSQQFETAGSVVDLQSTNPHLITSVLKLYLRELPEPLMTFDLYQEFIQIAKDSSGLKFARPEDGEDENDEENDAKCESVLRKLHECILRLPHANYFTVLRLFKHLKRVANNEVFNQMSCNNLAIIFGPNLLRPRGSASSLSALMDMPHQVRIVELLILNTNILDEDFGKAKTIDEGAEVHDDIDVKGPKRCSSAQSEQDQGYNTQPDIVDDGRQELSLSDELQIDFPEIFKRTDSDGRDFASSFGSLDSVPDMPSPDVDDELKDLIVKTKRPLPERPQSLNFEESDRVSSTQNLLSGSESNISFSSLSQVELPDSSMDLGRDEPDMESQKMDENSDQLDASNCSLDSLPRSRRTGQVTIDLGSTGDADCNEETGKVDSTSKDENREIMNTQNADLDNSLAGRINEEGDARAAGSLKEEVPVDDENASKIVTERESAKETASGISLKADTQNVDESEQRMKQQQKLPPRVAPKPTSPVRSVTSPGEIGNQKSDITTSITSSKEESDENEAECDITNCVSGNTQKLRQRFLEDVGTGDIENREKPDQNSGSSPSLSTNRKSMEGAGQGKTSVNRTISNTAKLVERFTKESDKRKDSRDSPIGSPLAGRGVSVRQMLKQFESGDEMDDDESRTPTRRQSGPSKDLRKDLQADSRKDSQTDTQKDPQTDSPRDHGVKTGSSSFPREQKPSSMSKHGEDKVRSVSDIGTRREPKFV